MQNTHLIVKIQSRGAKKNPSFLPSFHTHNLKKTHKIKKKQKQNDNGKLNRYYYYNLFFFLNEKYYSYFSIYIANFFFLFLFIYNGNILTFISRWKPVPRNHHLNSGMIFFAKKRLQKRKQWAKTRLTWWKKVNGRRTTRAQRTHYKELMPTELTRWPPHRAFHYGMVLAHAHNLPSPRGKGSAIFRYSPRSGFPLHSNKLRENFNSKNCRSLRSSPGACRTDFTPRAQPPVLQNLQHPAVNQRGMTAYELATPRDQNASAYD